MIRVQTRNKLEFQLQNMAKRQVLLEIQEHQNILKLTHLNSKVKEDQKAERERRRRLRSLEKKLFLVRWKKVQQTPYFSCKNLKPNIIEFNRPTKVV